MLFDKLKYKVVEIDGFLPMILVENHIRKNSKDYFNDIDLGGWGNGYVCLPNWHPFYKIDYDELNVNIHGGLTFSQLDKDHDLWVIGFDTNHYGDTLEYCSYEYVLEQTKYLRDQCMEVKEIKRIMKLNKIRKTMDL